MTSRQQQRISVVVPAFNSEFSLERCVSSILGQSYAPFEVLIYDDCSDDLTYSVAFALAEQDTRVKVFRGDVNRGAGHARTKLLQEVTGDYIAFLDSDDVWFPEKLERQMAEIQEKQLDICICGYEIRDSTGNQIGKRMALRRITWLSMHFANWIPMSMAVFRADLKASRRMPGIRRRQDYAYWLTLFRENKDLRAGGVAEILGAYYRSNMGLSSNQMTNIKSNYRMFKDALGYPNVLAALCVFSNVIIRLFRN